MQHHQIYKSEDQFIAMLDRRIPLDRRETEMAAIRAEMQWRQRCQLAGFRRLAAVSREAVDAKL